MLFWNIFLFVLYIYLFLLLYQCCSLAHYEVEIENEYDRRLVSYPLYRNFKCLTNAKPPHAQLQISMSLRKDFNPDFWKYIKQLRYLGNQI